MAPGSWQDRRMRALLAIDPIDLVGLDVYLMVIEDDSVACPAPPDFDAAGDDPVGTSGPLAGDQLGLTGPLSFEDVVSLEMEIE
jgi:hypothetical protein